MADYRLLSSGRASATRDALGSTVYPAIRGQRRAPRRPASGPSGSARGQARKRRQIDPAMVLAVGLAAGVISMAAQLALWALAGMPLFAALFRDARLTAAVILGTGVLPPPSTPRWDILLAATLIHFALSLAYALIPASLVDRLNTRTAIVGGALYGLTIYAINMYGFTLLFPWFAIARDWVTLTTHVVFGIALAWGCVLFARKFRKSPR